MEISLDKESKVVQIHWCKCSNKTCLY